MATEKLNDISWYSNEIALRRGEPGIQHSFMSSLATALNYISGELDPTRLMGTSVFAFRIWINETICPSAMSIFNWSVVLPDAVQLAGYKVRYISRLWHESEAEAERREEAHQAIIKGLDDGFPAIVWDIANAEWGLIIGYSNLMKSYQTLTNEGKLSKLPYNKLGKNGIDILSVTIPTIPNDKNDDEIINNSLHRAVDHAEQKEWTERPQYQDGLPGFDLWALIYDRWAMLVEAGKSDRIGSDIQSHAEYYAAHYYSARCYARDYLMGLSGGAPILQEAASYYERVAVLLKPVWEYSRATEQPEAARLGELADNLREAKKAECRGIRLMKDYLRIHVN